MTTYAAIDCGTHSVRLLISRVENPHQERPQITDVLRQMHIVQLGKGVDATGHLSEESLAKTLDRISEYAKLIKHYKVEKLRMVATSASRDADNAQDFVHGVYSRLGVEPEVISGYEEAGLSFAGATWAHGSNNTALVVDIGGGSTEFACGAKGRLAEAISINMGCTRISERFLQPTWDGEQRPSLAGIKAACDFIDDQLQQVRSRIDFPAVTELIGVAGSVTSVTALALGLQNYDPDRIDGAVLSVDEVLESCRKLVASSLLERKAIASLHPKRIDVIAGGALVWSRIVKALAQDPSQGAGLKQVSTSEHDILDGLILSQL